MQLMSHESLVTLMTLMTMMTLVTIVTLMNLMTLMTLMNPIVGAATQPTLLRRPVSYRPSLIMERPPQYYCIQHKSILLVL